MKRILYILTLAIFALVGCNGGNKATNAAGNAAQQSDNQNVAQVDFAETKVDTTVVNADGVKCQISVYLNYAKIGAVADAINAAILNCGLFPKECVGGSKAQDMHKKAQDVANHYIKAFLENDIDLPSDDTELFFDASSKVTFGRDSIINYQVGYDSFMGGVRPISKSVWLNFDPKTGAVIKWKDFIRPEAEGKIIDLIVANVADQYECASLQELQDNHLIFSEFDPYIPDNFLISRYFLEFGYECEEVAPYAVGYIKASIPYKDLEGCLK